MDVCKKSIAGECAICGLLPGERGICTQIRVPDFFEFILIFITCDVILTEFVDRNAVNPVKIGNCRATVNRMAGSQILVRS